MLLVGMTTNSYRFRKEPKRKTFDIVHLMRQLGKWLYRQTPWGAKVVRDFREIRKQYYILLNQANNAGLTEAIGMLNPVRFKMENIKSRLY